MPPVILAARGEKKDDIALNLETAVGSPKSPQALGAPRKTEKGLITPKVTTTFSVSRGTPISYGSFWRPTAVSRLNAGIQGSGLLHFLWCVKRNGNLDPRLQMSGMTWGEMGRP